VSRIQDERAERRAVDYRPLDQFRHRDLAANVASARALDPAWYCHAVPVIGLIRIFFRTFLRDCKLARASVLGNLGHSVRTRAICTFYHFRAANDYDNAKTFYDDVI